MTSATETHMRAALNYGQHAPAIYDAMDALDQYLATDSAIEKPLLHLVRLRASQLNGCAYCIDMHWKDLRAIGEGEQKLYGLDAWEESPYYTERERAAIAWTEAVTLLTDGHVSEQVYAEARSRFTAKELCDLTLAIATINAWNRLSIAARLDPGRYQASPRMQVMTEA
jgi:AhpD family alkylhydroperoxidase